MNTITRAEAEALNAATLAEIAAVECGQSRVVSAHGETCDSSDTEQCWHEVVSLTTSNGWVISVFLDGLGLEEWDYIDAIQAPGGAKVDPWGWAPGIGGRARFFGGVLEGIAYYRPDGVRAWMVTP